MSVEKLKLMNLIAIKSDYDNVLKTLVLMEKVHFIDATEEIEELNFTITLMEENIDEIIDIGKIHRYVGTSSLKLVKERLDYLFEHIKIEKKIDAGHLKKAYKQGVRVDVVNEMYSNFAEDIKSRKDYESELIKLKKMRIIKNVLEVDIDFKNLFDANFFEFKIGTVDKEGANKLKKNDENISATVLTLGQENNREILLIITPIRLKSENDRILKSVHFEEIIFENSYMDTPVKMLGKINSRIRRIETILVELGANEDEHQINYEEKIIKEYSQLVLSETINEIKKKTTVSEKFVYISGWVQESETMNIKKELESEYEIIVGCKDYIDANTKETPPTKLKNNKILKPFENLVEMYGVPSYEEKDPTIFLGIAYMILFGMMFGDLGQGFVLLLAGVYIAKKKSKMYGGLISRLGVSSMLFGFVYDSFFGYEHVISGLAVRVTKNNAIENMFIRPIENINAVLGASIVLGIVLLLLSLIYSVVNKIKVKDYEEGLFGRNGIAGIVLYASILGSGGLMLLSYKGLLLSVLIGAALASTIIIFVREPLASTLEGRQKKYKESAKEYYVESGFYIFETFLSILSNSLSFIRIGAFAINHVGLFIAFHTIAEIINSSFGNVLMFILGNLLVIFLEGLIVLIQGLRLVYYEMFSKYYTGDGYKFEPSKVEVIKN